MTEPTPNPQSPSEPLPQSVSLDPADARAALVAKVRRFPRAPGVYLMRDPKGRVIYVGKAKSLRARVGNYFQDNPEHTPKIIALVAEVVEVDFLETPSEADALLLESRLIKDIQPKYNNREKDDKTFPYIEITTRDDFPGVFLTRTPQDRGTKLYGPFTSVAWTREAISELQRVFKYRTCTLDIDAADDSRRHFRPCLLAHIDQCTAPCADRIDREEYRKDIDRFKRFLEGSRETVLRELREEMEFAASQLKFEEAKRIRDQIRAIESLAKRGSVRTHVQPEVFHADPRLGLEQLQKLLELPTLPRVLEGIDIATLQGGESVGSLVCFLDGKPHKKGYKRFRIKTVEGVDDYSMIREVVTRRYGKLQAQFDAAAEAGEPVEAESIFPDVVLIDGGLGQLHSAMDAFRECGVTAPKLISLAKREEEVYVTARSAPMRLPRNSPALKLLQYARDEAHRFAQHYHHLLRSKKTFEETLGTDAPRPKRTKKKSFPV